MFAPFVFLLIFSSQFVDALHMRDYSDGDRKVYAGYKVYEAEPSSDEQVGFFQNLMLQENTKVDFWQTTSHVGGKVTFMVAPEIQESVELKLQINGIAYREKISDLEEVLQPLLQQRFLVEKKFDLHDFNTLDNIYEWMKNLTSSCRADISCEVYSIGDSYEGRPIMVVKISKPGTVSKKGIWIDATIHAREWISTATLIKIINQLKTATDPATTRLLDNYDWYLAPVLNPDGYEYTFVKDRLWRKNRRPSSEKKCFGTDLNRNFNCSTTEACWGTDGVSHNPCSELYCGPSAESEQETKAIVSEAKRIGHQLIGWMTLHAYGNMWMFPFGNSQINSEGERVCRRAADHDDLMRVAKVASKAVESVYNTKWRTGTTCEVVYPNSGSSLDFAKVFAGVKYPYGLELRGIDFLVTKQQIRPSFVEVWRGIVAMCDAISIGKSAKSAKIGKSEKDNI